MLRILLIIFAFIFAIPATATAQQRSMPEILERLYGLCEQDYKPACIKLGLAIGKLPPPVERKLRREHPEWWWWLPW